MPSLGLSSLAHTWGEVPTLQDQGEEQVKKSTETQREGTVTLGPQATCRRRAELCFDPPSPEHGGYSATPFVGLTGARLNQDPWSQCCRAGQGVHGDPARSGQQFHRPASVCPLNTALLLRHVLAPPKGELGSCQRGPSWNSSSAMDLGEQGARAVSAGHVPKGREDPETQCVPANTRP